MVELVCTVKEPWVTELSTNMRARLTEALSLIASEHVQRKYQLDAPSVDVPAELFNQWEDCYFPSDETFRGAFEPAELDALRQFNDVLNEVCRETPQQLPPLTEFMSSAAWRKLSNGAKDALRALSPNRARK